MTGRPPRAAQPHTTRGLITALTALLAFASAGCSAAGSGDDGESADEVLTVEQARDAFENVGVDLDPALDLFYDEYTATSPSLPTLQGAALDVAQASEEIAADLSDIAWPADVDPSAVSAVSEDYQTYATQWTDVAGVDSLDEIPALLCEMERDTPAAEENVNRLRAELDQEAVDWDTSGACSSDRVRGDDAITP